jgi:CO dehydrogenase maturation factor
MAITIAISGKGGSGKTTLAAMIIRTLMGRTAKSILAVDADPNSCLGLTMGAEVTGAISDLREKARSKKPSNEGMDRIRSFEYDIQQAITEAKGFDLLTMGRPEGPDCYCAVNNVLRKFLDKLSSAYSFVVIDNEAGMEHLSRRTTNNVDLLCIVAESTPLGALTAQRIFDLAKQLPISGFIPYDKAVFKASMQGKTIFDLEDNNPAMLAVRKIIDQKLNFVKV